MKLSVIIVNYNTCTLLKQNINHLIDAAKSIDYEIVVVDNASTDGSLEMLADQFAHLKVIANSTYQGVAKANNQALEVANGEYVLLVGANTICATESLNKMLAFMDEHTQAAGLSVRLLTTEGRFLPESIHGLTKPWISFFKLFGFARHFSKSRFYDRNRKEWVEEFEVAEVDILNSACMLLRRSALEVTGWFDERFTMFGYNIDLSYRMRLAGLKNFYFPKTYFINYDSLGMPKLSWSYVKYFYGAMFIFAAKYLLKLPEIKVSGIPQLIPSSYEVK